MMPPPRPLTTASTITPVTSNFIRTAVIPPANAPAKMAAISNQTGRKSGWDVTGVVVVAAEGRTEATMLGTTVSTMLSSVPVLTALVAAEDAPEAVAVAVALAAATTLLAST